jgi:hypothetical protein
VIRKVYCVVLIIAAYLIVTPPAYSAVSQGITSFKDLKKIDIVVEDLDPTLGFTKKDILAYVTSKLRRRVPTLLIKRNVHDYVYIRIVALDVKQDHVAGNVSIALKRRLVLPDKETMITAGVRSYGNIFFVSKDNSLEYIKNILNSLLNSFVTDYRKARDYYSGKKKGIPRINKGRGGKSTGTENKVWGN